MNKILFGLGLVILLVGCVPYLTAKPMDIIPFPERQVGVTANTMYTYDGYNKVVDNLNSSNNGELSESDATIAYIVSTTTTTVKLESYSKRIISSDVPISIPLSDESGMREVSNMTIDVTSVDLNQQIIGKNLNVGDYIGMFIFGPTIQLSCYINEIKITSEYLGTSREVCISKIYFGSGDMSYNITIIYDRATGMTFGAAVDFAFKIPQAVDVSILTTIKIKSIVENAIKPVTRQLQYVIYYNNITETPSGFDVPKIFINNKFYDYTYRSPTNTDERQTLDFVFFANEEYAFKLSTYTSITTTEWSDDIQGFVDIIKYYKCDNTTMIINKSLVNRIYNFIYSETTEYYTIVPETHIIMVTAPKADTTYPKDLQLKIGATANGTVLKYTINYGDNKTEIGTFNPQMIFSHSYDTIGSYSINVTTTNEYDVTTNAYLTLVITENVLPLQQDFMLLLNEYKLYVIGLGGLMVLVSLFMNNKQKIPKMKPF